MRGTTPDEMLELLEELLDPATLMGALDRLEPLARDKKLDGRAVTCLIPLLHAPDPEVRRKASWLLGKLAQNKVEAFWPVERVTNLLHDDDPEVRENAAWSLGELAGVRVGNLGSIEHLNRLLADEHSSVRGMAAWALGRLAEKLGMAYASSLEPLSELASDRSELVRKSAYFAAERIKAVTLE